MNIKIDSRYMKKIILVICLIFLAVGWRIVNHNYNFAPNLELVTTASVLAVIILGWRAALVVPLTIMIVSDYIIGNSSIYIFTWSSFVIIGICAILLRRFTSRPKTQILYSVAFATTSSFLFFVVTNFGVWLQGWYLATWAGLIDCFISAIPFYRTMLIGNLILVPLSITILQLIKARQTVKSLVVNPLVGD